MANKLVLLALFVVVMLLMSWKYDKKKKIVFFGDSITQIGAQPGGYIMKIDSMIHHDGIGDKYELIGAGVSGNKVYDLYLRIDEVIAKSPDIVVVFVGVNDVWHKRSSGTGTDYDKFGKFYDAIVKKLQAAGSKVVVCTPAVIGEKTDNTNELDGDLNQYCKWLRSYAAQNSLPLIDLRKAFVEYNLQHNPDNKDFGILTRDKVHLNADGQVFVANQMWQVLKDVK
jgi:lysophospholipase L1-like esterase